MGENAWQKRRRLNGWSGGYVEWVDGKRACISVVFSWQLQRAYQRAVWLRSQGYFVRAGGPAVALNPDFLAGVAIQLNGGSTKALPHHNPNATFTTRGCIRSCPFCAVPKTEGALRELPDDEWEPRPLICDNNLLAASIGHFDHVIDRLLDSGVMGIDFNQGLDARLLTEHHALRLLELHQVGQLKMIRLAWDHISAESGFRRAHALLRSIGIPAGKISVYVLLGYNDAPDDALYRLSEVWALKSWPNPMRYQPLDAQKKNEYVSPNWTDDELRRYVKYWSNLRWLSSVPFSEYEYSRGHRVVAAVAAAGDEVGQGKEGA